MVCKGSGEIYAYYLYGDSIVYSDLQFTLLQYISRRIKKAHLWRQITALRQSSARELWPGNHLDLHFGTIRFPLNSTT